jgi:hypothetical protein
MMGSGGDGSVVEVALQEFLDPRVREFLERDFHNATIPA